MEKSNCRHTVSIVYHSDSCDVVWNDLPNRPETQSFESTTEAWEFATDKIKEIFWETELKDCAIDLDEQCTKCGQVPLKFIGWS